MQHVTFHEWRDTLDWFLVNLLGLNHGALDAYDWRALFEAGHDPQSALAQWRSAQLAAHDI